MWQTITLKEKHFVLIYKLRIYLFIQITMLLCINSFSNNYDIGNIHELTIGTYGVRFCYRVTTQKARQHLTTS